MHSDLIVEPASRPVDPTIVLREPVDGDFSPLAGMRRDAGLQSLLLTIPDAVDDAAIRTWIERRRADPGGAFRVVEDAATKAFLGYVQVGQVHRRSRFGYGGLALVSSARGRGIGRATLLALIETAKTQLGLHKLLAEIRSDNERSLRLHLSLGYRLVGTLRDHFIEGDVRHDVLLLERLLASEPR